MKICKVEGCNNKYYAKGYCSKHYQQKWWYGKILERTKNDKNEIIDCEDYYGVCVYNKKHKEIARIKIDKEDLEKVKKYRWSLNNERYASATKNKKYIKIHQLILGKKEGLEIDHINHNKLDNRRQNLRHCTHQQNCANQKSIGVHWEKKNKKWHSSISNKNVIIHLGYFVKRQDAILARREAEKKYYGEFAYSD